MSNLNWPEGATHYLQAGEEQTRFRDLSGEQWKYFNSYTGEWVQHYFSSEDLLRRHDLIARPQTKPWSGPEDGLPPVDSHVMVHECTHDYTKQFNNQIVRIVAHDQGKYAVFAADNFVYHALVAEKFKLPPTPEQLAAEERERAIDSMVEEIVGYFEYPKAAEQYIGLATRLHDKGFKREVV